MPICFMQCGSKRFKLATSWGPLPFLDWKSIELRCFSSYQDWHKTDHQLIKYSKSFQGHFLYFHTCLNRKCYVHVNLWRSVLLVGLIDLWLMLTKSKIFLMDNKYLFSLKFLVQNFEKVNMFYVHAYSPWSQLSNEFPSNPPYQK